MVWESLGEGEDESREDNVPLSEREEWYRAGEELEEELATAEKDLEESLEKCWQVLSRRT